VGEPSTASAGGVVSFGPFQLLPGQQLLLEGEVPVPLGSRALAILTTLAERPGELVSKGELMARVWPDTFVDEAALRVHISALRRALGDGQAGRRFLANVPGRGYQLVAPVEISEPRTALSHAEIAGSRPHNLPVVRTRAVGRAGAVRALADLLPKQRFITIVGAGGIGKTTVALTLAESLLPAYEDGIRIVDLAPIDGPQFVLSALGAVLGLSIDPENAAVQLVDFLRDKRMLIVLDSCEHVIDAAASLAEQLVAGVPGVHILATSREPLRAKGERVHRLQPLDVPADPSQLTAAEALAYPAVQLFVERAAAILDGFELSDADAPIVSAICHKLGGIALAIELAAARVDAFSIRQLKLLLDDRIRILSQGRRTAQPRHQSLAAALDWSYEFLPEIERAVLCRLSVFAGAFTLDSAIAVAGDDNIEVVEALANLVAKSLIAADVGGAIVRYRLLDTTRAYAMGKLGERGEAEHTARRHAEFFRDFFAAIDTPSQIEATAEDRIRYRQEIDNVRAALDWSFSPGGDPSIGIVLTAAYVWVWLNLSLYFECRERAEQALDHIATGSEPGVPLRLQLLLALSMALTNMMGPPERIKEVLVTALQIAESHNDLGTHLWILWALWSFQLNIGECREAQSTAERFCQVAPRTGDPANILPGFRLLGTALQSGGDQHEARRSLTRALEPPYSATDPQHPVWPQQHRAMTLATLARTLWLQGFAHQARDKARESHDEACADALALLQFEVLRLAVGPVALMSGDEAAAGQAVATMADLAASTNAAFWKIISQCFESTVLIRRGEFEKGLTLLGAVLDTCEKTGWKPGYPEYLGVLAEGLAGLERYAEAVATVDKALAAADYSGERWYVAELLRAKGEFLLQEGGDNSAPVAEGWFREALALAQKQDALSWELRAAMSLGKLWHQNGKTSEANELVSAVYDRFTEGFDTADLRTARTLTDKFRGELGKA
jgi:predicted ATPase/DNA-binding winged helix-turn-helix (wHTH) protein